jgi:hypothetical protein
MQEQRFHLGSPRQQASRGSNRAKTLDPVLTLVDRSDAASRPDGLGKAPGAIVRD